MLRGDTNMLRGSTNMLRGGGTTNIYQDTTSRRTRRGLPLASRPVLYRNRTPMTHSRRNQPDRPNRSMTDYDDIRVCHLCKRPHLVHLSITDTYIDVTCPDQDRTYRLSRY